ncbi:MAG: ABC transporter ATP-binding protein [Pseudomonadota bacterium]
MSSLPLGREGTALSRFLSSEPQPHSVPPQRRDARPAPVALGSADTDPVLALEDIHLSFGGVSALSGVNLRLAPGEIHAVIGPNGAGKSSLVNVISGLYRPDRGRIQLAGRSFQQVPTPQLARLGVARTFQNLALFKGLSVRDNVAIGRVHQGRATVVEQLLNLGRAPRERRDATARAEQVLAVLGLQEVRERLVGTLSYGLQKRVELARALVARPPLLLLDEPMAGLTAADKQAMARCVRAARDEFGAAILLIEHDIGIVLGLSDRVTVLDHGRRIAVGTPSEVRENPAVIDAYLGVAHPEPQGDEVLPATGTPLQFDLQAVGG